MSKNEVLLLSIGSIGASSLTSINDIEVKVKGLKNIELDSLSVLM